MWAVIVVFKLEILKIQLLRSSKRLIKKMSNNLRFNLIFSLFFQSDGDMIGNYTEEVVLFKVTCDPQAAAQAACDGPEHWTGASELLCDSPLSLFVVIKV